MACEDEGIPLLRVQFRDADTAHSLRLRVARLLRELEGVGRVASDPSQPSATAELLVWPPKPTVLPDQLPEQLFIEDTQPFSIEQINVPSYNKKFAILNDEIEPKEIAVKRPYRVQECFNCEGNHLLQNCTLPKDFTKINQKRKEMKIKNLRYHAEDHAESQDDRVVPGKISRKLRHALGLQRNQIPIHIYRMRVLGYPPGWLLNAKVSHSGISLFDSTGKAVESDDENSNHSNSKDEYDINKIIDFPGFNVPASSKYIEESNIYGYPPYNEDHSKMLMIERLAPRAARAYKRKKMAVVVPEKQAGDKSFPTDMEIENDDNEYFENGNVNMLFPPLPMENLPPPPPSDLPPLPPPPSNSPPPLPPGVLPEPSTPNDTQKINDANEESPRSASPSLADLESQKLLIMAALEEKEQLERNQSLNLSKSLNGNTDSTLDDESMVSSDCDAISKSNSSTSLSAEILPSQTNDSTTTTPLRGRIRDSVLGTPVHNISPFNDLPSDSKFSKDICDVINFENLPDSTGKYVQMSGLIKKVRESLSQLQQEH